MTAKNETTNQTSENMTAKNETTNQTSENMTAKNETTIQTPGKLDRIGLNYSLRNIFFSDNYYNCEKYNKEIMDHIRKIYDVKTVNEVFNTVITREKRGKYGNNNRDFDRCVLFKCELEKMCLGEFTSFTFWKFLLLLEVLITDCDGNKVIELLEKRNLVNAYMSSKKDSKQTFEILQFFYVRGDWSRLLNILNYVKNKKQYENIINIISSSPDNQINKLIKETPHNLKYIPLTYQLNFNYIKHVADSSFDEKKYVYNMNKKQLLAHLLYEILVDYSKKFIEFHSTQTEILNKRKVDSDIKNPINKYPCIEILCFCVCSDLHCKDILNFFLKLHQNRILSEEQIEYLCLEYFKELTILHKFKDLLNFYVECEETNSLNNKTLLDSWEPLGFSPSKFICKFIENYWNLRYLKKYKILVEKYDEIRVKMSDISYIEGLMEKSLTSRLKYFVILSYVMAKEPLVDLLVDAEKSLRLITDKDIILHKFFDENIYNYLIDKMIQKHTTFLVLRGLHRLQYCLKNYIKMRCFVISKMNNILITNGIDLRTFDVCTDKIDNEDFDAFISFFENNKNLQIIFNLFDVATESKKLLDNIVNGTTKSQEIVWIPFKYVFDYASNQNFYKNFSIIKIFIAQKFFKNS